MVIFHKYYLINKENFSNSQDVILSGLSSLFIAIKSSYGYVKIENFSTAVIRSLDKKRYNNMKDYSNDEIGEKILINEVKILINIGFDLDIILPYRYLDNFLGYLTNNLYENLKNFLQTTNNFINDSFKIPLCLYFDPNLIALTSILLTTKLFNITLPDLDDGRKWYNLIDKSIKYETLIEIANLINKMYMIISFPNNKISEVLDISSINKKKVCIIKKPSNKLNH